MIKFAHTNIISKDWKRLADFYIQVFGCKPVFPERDLKGTWLDKATNIEDAHIRGIHLALPGYDKNPPTIEIFQYDHVIEKSESMPNRKGYGHIAFRVDDVDEVLKKLLETGGTLLGEVVETEIANAGYIRFVYAKDIDGNIIELQSWK